MKNLKNLGKALNKEEQKEVFGGGIAPFFDFCDGAGSVGNRCRTDANCCPGERCGNTLYYQGVCLD